MQEVVHVRRGCRYVVTPEATCPSNARRCGGNMAHNASQRQQRLSEYLVRRRSLLKAGAAAAAALATPRLIGSSWAAPAEPLHFVGWQYNPQIVAENVDIFKKLYDENVEYELVPGEYHAIAETKLIAGQHIDMMYSRGGPSGPLAPGEAGCGTSTTCPASTRSRPACTPSTSATCRCRTASSAACPTTRGFNSFVVQPEAPRQGQAAAAGDLGRVPRPVPQAEEGWRRRVPLHQRLAAASGRACPGACSRSGTPRAPRSSTTSSIRCSTTSSSKVLELHRTLYAGGAGAARHLHPRSRKACRTSPAVRTRTWSCTSTTRRC